MISEDLEEWIDQAELSEDCPCSSDKAFGACCGAYFPCDCNSKEVAIECCYLGSNEEEMTG
ncbi:MAG: hypothetical protein EA369_00455 [Bradymonadales bacterium]|nr:MAG: hypothetical protein EA369_00455 [Bradymonadales bacterium]